MATKPILLAAALALTATACAPAVAPSAPGGRAVPDHSPMLERVLPAVLTVAGRMGDDEPRAFGFGGAADNGGQPAARSAYHRMLDLSPYDMSGSGFVIERDGRRFVVTNAHVIDHADPDDIHGFSVDRRRYRMRLVGVDTYRDVAVLEFIERPGQEIGTIGIRAVDDVRVGQPVFVVGNPMGGFPYSVTSGIISALNRTLSGTYGKHGYLQTDASVAGGNSGGPLIGMNGDVVGLITSGYTNPFSASLNFALDARHLNRIVDDIIRHGRVQRAWLGAILEREWNFVAGNSIVKLTGTMPGSPAAGALASHVGSQLVAINGEAIESVDDAVGILEQLTPGSAVEMTLLRAGGQRATARVTAGTLGTQQTAQIGTHLLNEMFGVQVVQGGSGSGLSVTRAPARVPAGTFTSDRNPPRAGETIRYAGTATNVEDQVWRVASLHDLGVISRMAMPAGMYIVFLESRQGERWAAAEFEPSVIL